MGLISKSSQDKTGVSQVPSSIIDCIENNPSVLFRFNMFHYHADEMTVNNSTDASYFLLMTNGILQVE